MATPLPITELPIPYGNAGVPFVWTAGDNVNENTFVATNAEILVAYNADIGTSGLIVLAVNATGGTFDATYGGQTASGVAWNVTPSALQIALRALPGAPLFAVTGVATTSGHTGIYVIQGPVGTVLTALTTAVGSLTGGSSMADVFAGPVGGAGTSHAHTIKSVADIPMNRVGDITDTLTPGQYRVYQQFPTAGWASFGVIEVQPASAEILYAVFRVVS